jgi:hypothetical protein
MVLFYEVQYPSHESKRQTAYEQTRPIIANNGLDFALSLIFHQIDNFNNQFERF